MNLIPWIEVNRGTDAEVDHAVAGLRVWQLVAKTAIVSTAPGHAPFYSRLRALLPDLTLIPGMKTVARLGKGKFDSPEAWALVASDVQAVATAAASSLVLLEHESALTPYWKSTGYAVLDVARLREALQALPPAISLLWYPGLVGESTRTQDVSAAICTAADSLGRVRLLDHWCAAPQSPTYSWSKRAKTRLDELATRSPLPLVYVGTLGPRTYWPYAETPEVLTQVGREAVVYPGARNWVAAAIAVSLAVNAAAGA